MDCKYPRSDFATGVAWPDPAHVDTCERLETSRVPTTSVFWESESLRAFVTSVMASCGGDVATPRLHFQELGANPFRVGRPSHRCRCVLTAHDGRGDL